MGSQRSAGPTFSFMEGEMQLGSHLEVGSDLAPLSLHFWAKIYPSLYFPWFLFCSNSSLPFAEPAGHCLSNTLKSSCLDFLFNSQAQDPQMAQQEASGR